MPRSSRPPSAAPTLRFPREDARAFQVALAGWFASCKRDLPWRRRKSLYATVVSEFMLQQTQVVTVLPYFERWMCELPDFAALAAAGEARVLKLWEGLGYYSRARNLHRLAKRVTTEGTPDSIEGWLEMPGVGPYAAAAIGSIAQGLPAAVVDGNVVRIVARITGDGTAYKSGSAAAKASTAVAQALLDTQDPGTHNEAMMELGATVCLKTRPLCLFCPVREWCHAGRMGNAADFPRIERPRTEKVTVRRAWLLRDESILLERQGPDAQRLAGFWELPRLQGIEEGWPLISRKTRGISNQRITEEIYSPLETPLVQAGLQWVAFKDLDAIQLSGPHRKWIGELLRRESAY